MDRKIPLCEVLVAAPRKVAAVGEANGKTPLPEAPATPGTGAGAGAAVAPASLGAGVPAARPTLVPEVAKCIWGTAS